MEKSSIFTDISGSVASGKEYTRSTSSSTHSQSRTFKMNKSKTNKICNSYTGYLTQVMLSPNEDKQNACMFTHILYDSLKINIIDHFIKIYTDYYKLSCKSNKNIVEIDNYLNNIVTFFYNGCMKGLLKVSDSQIIIISGFTKKNNKDHNNMLKKCIKYLCDKTKKYEENISSVEKKVNHIFDSNNFMAIPPNSMALQITFTITKYFRAITSSDLLHAKLSDNINNLIKYFDKIAYLVPTEILTMNKKNKQCECVKYFISVATKLKKLNNFHGLMAIIAGLNNNALTRLKYLWKDEYLYEFEELNNIMSFYNNFNTYRSYIQNSTKLHGTIPYLGIELSDIIHNCEQPIIIKTCPLMNH
jgi:hypothetical protein